MQLRDAVIEAVDAENRTFTATGLLEGWVTWVKSNTTKTLRLQVPAGARITQGNKIAKLADLKISDKVQIKFRTEGKGETATHNVITVARGGSFRGAPTMIWLCGRIASLDAGAGRVTVAPLRPGPGDWKGLRHFDRICTLTSPFSPPTEMGVSCSTVFGALRFCTKSTMPPQ